VVVYTSVSRGRSAEIQRTLVAERMALVCFTTMRVFHVTSGVKPLYISGVSPIPVCCISIQ